MSLSTRSRSEVPAGVPARGHSLLQVVGELLLTLGVLLLLFCVYEVYGTNVVTGREQRQLGQDLAQDWAAPPAAGPTKAVAREPPLGRAFARLYLPRLDGSSALVVVQGVSVEDLKKGPGHLPGSALPGERGNLVLSGHRTTYGAPFSELDRLRAGDAIVVETRDTWFTYRVTRQEVVQPDAVEVTYPVPGEPGAPPRERVITLTTCHPRYSARQRLIISGRLADRQPTASGRPAALGEA